MVIRDARTRRIHEGIVVLGIPSDVQQLARRRLRMLDNVCGIEEMYRMPRARPRRRCRDEGRACHAVAIARGWELRFEWRRGSAQGVELVERRPAQAC
jgi:proteic killer suppression protein